MDDNFFGGAPTLSWSSKTEGGGYVDRKDLLGVIRGGVITDITGAQQATDIVTGKPAWWEPPTATSPGRAKMQYVLTLRCDGSTHPTASSGQPLSVRDERQVGVGNDTGDRRMFIPDGDMRKAVGDAFRANGCKGLTVGDELYLVWTGYRPSKVKGGKDAKTWAALHVKGTAPAQQWPQDGENSAAGAQAGVNPFAPQGAAQPAQGPTTVYGNGPQQGQPVPVGQGPGAAPPPSSNPFGGPIPEQAPPTPAANPFA